MTSENTREIVLDILLEIQRNAQYSNHLLKAVLDKYNYLSAQEKAFIKRLTEGTIERQIELDYILDLYSSVPVKKMKPLIRCLMRMSTYQILYMDAIPDSAVCNEAVKLAGKRKFTNLKGFVNGVLRKIVREKDRIPYPQKDKDFTLYLSVRYSMPYWLVVMWLEEYGTEITERLLENLLEVHPVSIRFDTRLDKETQLEYIAQMEKNGVDVTPSAYLPYAYLLSNIDGVTSLPGYKQGVLTVQDVSSMLAVEAAGIQTGDIVLDACAAPGGKSLLASEKASLVIARDVTLEKIRLLEENAKRLRAANLSVEQWNAVVWDASRQESVDVLLLDVPCSGLGVIGKKRDIKYHVTLQGMQELNVLQKDIVRTCWQYVKPGGTLLYSTCTIHKEENEDMVKWICEELPFEPVSLENLLPKRLWEEKKELCEKLQEEKKRLAQSKGKKSSDTKKIGFIKTDITNLAITNLTIWENGLSKEQESCCLQMLPGYMESDGFFLALFRRKSE